MENLVTLLLDQINIYIREHRFSLTIVAVGVVLRYGFTKIKFRYSYTPVKTFLTSLLAVIGVNAFLSFAYQEGSNSKYDYGIKGLILFVYFVYSIKNECKKDNHETTTKIFIFVKYYFITVLSFTDSYFIIIVGSLVACAITFLIFCFHKKYDNLLLKSQYIEILLLCLELIIVFIICKRQTDMIKEVLLNALITETVVFSYHPFALYVIKKLCHEDTMFYWESQMGYDEQ